MTFKKTKKPISHYLKQAPYTSADFIVGGLLYVDAGRPSVLTGLPHTGKSTLARQLALAVARGEPFLDRETVQSKVILWLTEDSDRQIGQAIRRSGFKLNEKNLIILSQDLHAPTWQEELHHELEKNPDTRLCIIETLADFLVGSVATNTAAKRAMTTFKKDFVKVYNDCVFLFLHHNAKSSTNNSGPVAAKMLGATKLWGELDTTICLEPSSGFDPRRIISANTRGTDGCRDIPRTYLDFDKSTSRATLSEVVDLGSLSEIEFHNQILEFVERNPGWTKTKIYEGMRDEGTGRDRSKHLTFIDKMVADGHLVAVKGKGSGSPEHLYRAGLEPGGKAETALELVTKGFQQKARTVHPDAGGTHEGMQDLNAAKDFAAKAVRDAATGAGAGA